MELTTYEKELCKLDNMMLAGIIVNNITEDGYYISKSGEKVYTAILLQEDKVTNLITTIMREENGEMIGYAAYFLNDKLMSDMYEQYPELLPENCPTILAYEEIKQVPLVVTGYEKGKSIKFRYKGAPYETTPVEEFDGTDYQWWAMFALNMYMEMEVETTLPE